MASKNTDINLLGYMGVSSEQSPNVVYMTRSPVNPNDWRGFNIGDFWVVRSPRELWYLASLANDGSQKHSMATWVKLYPDTGSSGGAEHYPTDVGSASEIDGVLRILGGSNITTSGFGNTVSIVSNSSISNSGDLTVLGVVTLKDLKDGVVQADADGSIYTSRGTDGQLFIGRTNQNQVLNFLTSSNNSIMITYGPGFIDLSASGGGVGGATDFPTDAGTAIEAAAILNIVGGTNMNTSGSGNTVSIHLNDSISLSGDLTVNGPIIMHNAKNGVLSVDSSGVVSASRGSQGQVLIGMTGFNPVWGSLTSTNNSIHIVPGEGSIGLSVADGGGGEVSSSFSAYKTSDTNLPTSGASPNIVPFICDNVLIDDGGNYDPVIGSFTVPSNGYYFFNVALSAINAPVNMYASQPNYPCDLYLDVDGTTYKLAGEMCYINSPQTTMANSRSRQRGSTKASLLLYLEAGWRVMPLVRYDVVSGYVAMVLGDQNSFMTSFNGYRVK